MSEEKEKNKFFSKITEKLKKIKHLDIILTVLFIAIILLIYFSTTGLFNTNDDVEQDTQLNTGQVSDFEAYSKDLTSKLEELIGALDGAGQTKVMLYFEEGITTEIAYTTEIKTLSDGTQVEVKSPVLITNDGKEEPIILQEIMPKPVSIVIVASGAKNTNVKLEIIRLVQAMFELSTSKIEVFAGN